MTSKKPSTVTSATGAYSYKSGVSSNTFNYIDNQFPNLLDKTGDNLSTTPPGGISGVIDVLNGGAIQWQSGSALNLIGASSMTVNGTSQITFNNSSVLELNDTSLMLTGGSTQMLIGGTMNITSGGTFNLNSTGNMHIKNGATMTVDSGGTVAYASGAIGTVTGAATMTYSSGANLNMNTGTFLNLNGTVIGTGALIDLTSATTLILANGGGSFLTIGTGNLFNIHGNFKTDVWGSWNTPQTRQSCMTIDYSAVGQGASNWLNVGSGAGLQNTNGASPQIIGQQTLQIPLQRLHNGSTLASVFIAFIVGTSHTGVPANLPTFSVYRSNTLSNPTSVQYLNTIAVQSPTNPGSGSAWYDSGNVQYYQYITNQHNVIDNTNYTYWMSVVDESGTNSLGGNFYCSVTAENQIVNDQSWNI